MARQEDAIASGFDADTAEEAASRGAIGQKGRSAGRAVVDVPLRQPNQPGLDEIEAVEIRPNVIGMPRGGMVARRVVQLDTPVELRQLFLGNSHEGAVR